MECKELIVDTLYNLNAVQFEELRSTLVSEYIPFVVMKKEELTSELWPSAPFFLQPIPENFT